METPIEKTPEEKNLLPGKLITPPPGLTYIYITIVVVFLFSSLKARSKQHVCIQETPNLAEVLSLQNLPAIYRVFFGQILDATKTSPICRAPELFKSFFYLNYCSPFGTLFPSPFPVTLPLSASSPPSWATT